MFSRLKVTTYSRMISKSCLLSQSYSQNRALHVFHRTKDHATKTNCLGCFSSSSVYNTSFVRYASTSETPITPLQEELPLIPDAPIIPPEITEVIGEASLRSFELGSYYTPVGWMQHLLFSIHTTCGLPWWATIIVGTTILRCATLPIFIATQRHLALRDVYKKDLSYLDKKRKEATEDNDHFRSNMYMQKQEIFYAKHGMLTTMKLGRNTGLQGLCFASFFLAINKMARAPLPSLQEGGLAWFRDLTVTDPYYILPVIGCTFTAIYMYLTPTPTLAASVNFNRIQKIKYAIPVIALIPMIYFKTAVLLYGITTAWLTFIFQALVRVPKIRAFCKIAPIIKHQEIPRDTSSKIQNESFLEQVKDVLRKIKKNRNRRSAMSLDQRQFQSAGRGPLVKTYKFDPTKVTMRKEIK
ncbi:mitochondrial inner membrane protein OXA1L-like [Leptopilina boulardi]|uniref:mitochondrial inner membrane protein OXA1L-like n=1 Tax=Leptopilina boulardi TaxID=63433 RepID=UPI0021F535F6|nr:mitochondrial inner membrane protein OXA1L-like [Leptopilina boulardi]